jgi:tetraacyldisaccharide 4'-kinase
LLERLYSQLARSRRRYYERRPHLRRRLTAPVISIGNLTVGGSGKTPLAGAIARMLLENGERPSILSRGYARTRPSEGVVIVSDGVAVRTDVDHGGDEPFMLARAVPGAAVVVCPSRYLAGRVAEARLGCTVHILDDGFQHVELARDVDLLVAPDDLEHVRTLPFGRFRESLDAAAAASALLVPITDGAIPSDMAERLHVTPAFGFTRRLVDATARRPAFAFAGIARPERFFADLERSGWSLTGRRSFRDHHAYSSADLEALGRAARDSGAELIVTTEKDAVRFAARGEGLPIVAVPLETSIEPEFGIWLRDRLQSVRAA